MPADELSFVEWLRRNNPPHTAIELPIGDDMGMLHCNARRVLLSSDLLLDGVHVDSRVHSYERIGRKALGRSLSDCAAMAVKPVVATVSVAFPRATEERDKHALFRGIWELAETFNVGIIGGDTAVWVHPLCVDVTVQAEPYDGIEPVTRGGARPGDRLFVTGKLGGSILGKHIDFTPRIREAESIARKLGSALHAMIDISDGLSLDLWRLCEASSVAAVLDELELSRIASMEAMETGAGDERAVLSHVLSDGEDHELLMAVSPDVEFSGDSVHSIGTVVAGGSKLHMRSKQGELQPIVPIGYIHKSENVK